MDTSEVQSAYQTLRSDAEEHHSGRRAMYRVAVQVGHGSRAVGAEDIVAAVRESLPHNAFMVVAGDDGASFAMPQLLVVTPEARWHRFPRVTPEHARHVMSHVASRNVFGSIENNDFYTRQTRWTLDLCGVLAATDIDDYVLHGGYSGLAKSLAMSPEDVIERVKASGLRGRGGAYFPAALKWESARSFKNEPRYLVVNCEEGEPGIFKDRHLMEGVPHRILEGMAIAAYASGVNHAYIYINAEANLSAERMQDAYNQAIEKGIFGKNILDSGFVLHVEIMRGAGGYVCGEETTLLNTMEGYRREPRLRPPFPTEAGLWAKPTVINNAETLASLPYILDKGADEYAAIGTDSDKGTKIISISGAVRRPGIAEVPMGTTLRELVYDIGGGIRDDRPLTAIAVGGPSSGVLPVSMLDTPIKPSFLHQSGVMLGAGGVIAIDDSMSVLEVVRGLAAYNADESCGKCTPCREGTPRMVELLDKLSDGHATGEDLSSLRELAQTVNAASLCGLGQAAGNPILSALHFFGDELALLSES